MTTRWYALICKNKKEDILLRQLESRGYEIFYPRYSTGSGKSGKSQTRAYFPGYLFIKLDFNKDTISTFQWMPNTDGLVCFGSKPAYVPDNLVEAIRRHTAKQPAEETPDQKQAEGDCGTPAEHYDGFGEIFDPCLSSDQRVGQLLRMMQQGMSFSSAISD